ncbi:MAG: acyltransferase family protein [Deltaproteobacteria bacterium]|nr:acyltransferase family protein [Deltaproteobacteria bacterium]MBW2446238.1 acyltransferase family protein [Deltaproteobacteria bacterium]
MKPPRPPEILSLDAVPGESLGVPNGEARRALGRDPFASDPVSDPFVDRLAELRGTATPPLPEPTPPKTAPPEAREPESREPEPDSLRDSGRESERESERAWTRTPRIDEIELPLPSGFAERLLDDDVRRRLAALTHMAEGGAPYDRFGFSPAAAQTAFPLFHALYRAYFRVRSEGHERVPVEGPAVLAANHGGLLPFDGAMTVVDVLLHTDPPRLARAVVDRWAGTLPWVNVFFARMGQVVGTRENVMDLLDDGQLVLVFPEGMDGVRKNVTQRYRLQRFHVGFVEAALRAQAPIVPMAVVGSDDQAPILFDLSELARRFRVPFFPVTPTFPWLGPLGLLPYPVSYRIVYGEPLHFHEKFGPDAADDPQLVRYLANQVRRDIQLLLDRNR